MSVVAQVLERLTTELPGFGTVAAAWTSRPLANFDAQLPAALVYLAAVESAPSEFANATAQPGGYSVAVLTACAPAELETRVGQVRAALVGFELSGGSWAPFEHVTGDSVEISGGISWWRDVFSVENYE